MTAAAPLGLVTFLFTDIEGRPVGGKSAVDASVAAQRGLELPVRMGLATGEAELRDEDYFGAVLNRAARVMAAGHGGQVLLAESTASLITGVDLLDLGHDGCVTCARP